MYFLQQLHDLRTDRVKIGIDLGQIAWRLVLIKMPVERNFITDDTDLLSLSSFLLASIHASSTCGCTSLMKYASFNSLTCLDGSSATFSKSRRSPSALYSITLPSTANRP